MFAVVVKRRSGATRSRDAWEVVDADAVSYDTVGPKVAEMPKKYIQELNEKEKKAGSEFTYSFAIYVRDMDTPATRMTAMSFDRMSLPPYQASWKESLCKAVNDGKSSVVS